jgi:hypothetical protein
MNNDNKNIADQFYKPMRVTIGIYLYILSEIVKISPKVIMTFSHQVSPPFSLCDMLIFERQTSLQKS